MVVTVMGFSPSAIKTSASSCGKLIYRGFPIHLCVQLAWTRHIFNDIIYQYYRIILPFYVVRCFSDGALSLSRFGDQIFTVASMLLCISILLLLTLPSFLSHDCSLAAGSYVALTVLGRPPGLPQIPLEEAEGEEKEEGAEVSSSTSLSAPHSPALPGGEKCSHVTSGTSCGPQEHITSALLDGVRFHV